MKKRIFSIVLCMFLLFSLTACGDGGFTPAQKAFDTKVSTSVLADGKVIAQNDKFSLVYAADTASVNIVDNATGTTWDICPKSTGEVEYDSFGLPIKDNSFVESALQVAYMDTNIRGGGNSSVSTFDSVVEGGRTVVKEIENGVTVEYYFDGEGFMIPVNYVLKDDYLSISIDTTKIQETDLRVTAISIAPFLNSVENNSENSYLFIPSGSGALMNVNSYDEQGLNYKAYVYGEDFTMENKYIPTEEKEIRMPVYGYKNGDKGGFSIIESGAETAIINTTVGSTSYKFSSIYPSFQVRGYTEHEARTFNTTYYANVYPENMIEATLSVRFYPLMNEDANYSAMADIYRDYLVDEKGLTETDGDKSLNVTLIGGTQITKSFLGVPYDTVFATTTVDEASSIVSELSEKVSDLSVKLKGFGATGVDIGKIGGGYTVNGNLGSASKLKNLSSLCDDKNIDLYYDYDLVRFNTSGNGFSHYSDSVMNSGMLKAEHYIADKANRGENEDQTFRLLRPLNFADAVSKAVKQNNKWNIGGISLETLTSYSYSDYSDYHDTVDYNSKNGFSAAVTESLKQIKENNQKLMATDANEYAAIAADLVVDVPTTSDNGYAFEESVPFYSMVLKGYVAMAGESVNLASNTQKAILGSVESGIALNYTVINRWDNSLIDAVYPYFYSTVYSAVKQEIIDTCGELSNYYQSINGAKIVSNTVISSGVHCTVFDNGVTVYVNYNSNAVSTSAGEVPAMGYVITGGAA